MSKADVSVGALVFNSEKGFLFLKRKDKPTTWEFPKGHIEEFETELDTLKRELNEECKITDFELLAGFRKKSSYPKQNFTRVVIVYLIKTNQKPQLSNEHEEYKWLSPEDARLLLEELYSKNQMKYVQWLRIFDEAVNYLRSNNYL